LAHVWRFFRRRFRLDHAEKIARSPRAVTPHDDLVSAPHRHNPLRHSRLAGAIAASRQTVYAEPQPVAV
jgi:hypothetical protein